MTTLVFVRHGVTQENLNHTLIGRTDPSLHPYGIIQAQAVADALSTIHIDAVVSSPLRRCLQTAEEIAARLETIEVTTMSDLTEIDLGIVDGLSSFVAYERYKTLMDQALDVALPDFRFPKGESRKNALCRFQTAINRLVNKYPCGHVCIVTHGGLLGLWLAHLQNVPIGQFRYWQPSHGSISRVMFEDGNYRVISHNETEHLSRELQEMIEQARNRVP